MRGVVMLSSWRWSHWLVLLIAACSVALFLGVLPPLPEVVTWLASQPRLGGAFHDPSFGQQDALVFLFTVFFLAPLGVLIAVFLVAFGLAVLGGLLLPIARAFRMPDWVATALAIAAVAIAAYVQSNVWLPRSLWLLGLIARAYRVGMT